MKIGIICSKAPFPIIDGGNFASVALIQSLAIGNELNAFILHTSKHPFTKESETFSEHNFTSYKKQFLNTETSFFGLIRSFFKRESYNLSRFTNSEFQQQLPAFLHSGFNTLILDSLYSAVELNLIRSHFKGKIILRTHNLEFEIWERLAEIEKRAPKKWLYSYFSKRLKKEEIAIFQQVDEIWSISFADAIKLQSHTDTPVYTIGIGVPIPSELKNTDEFKAFHLGGMNWKPNKESANFIVDEIWKSDFTISISLIGNGTKELTSQNKAISFAGRIDSLEEIYSQHAVLVAPIFSGSGIRIKILEALSYGKACITSEIGAEGIDINESGILIADSGEAFRKQLMRLATDKELLENLKSKAKRYMEKHHNFNQISEVVRLRINAKING